MPDRALDIAFWNYDRTRALSDGRVTIDGVAARFHTERIVPPIFERMIRRRAYDVSELDLTYFLRTFADGPSPFLAIPAFRTGPSATRRSTSARRAASGIPATS